MLSLGTLATFNQLRSVAVADLRSFTGEVRLGRQPMLVKMPKLSRLESVLVSEGQTVQAGQTLAVLDTATMTTKLAHLERRLLVMQFARECSLDNRMVGHLDRWVKAEQIEMRAQLRIAAEDCDVSFDRSTLMASYAKDDIAYLSQRLVLLGKRVALLQGKAAVPSQHDLVQDLVDTLLAKSALETEIARALFRKAGDELTLRQNAVANAQAKTLEISAVQDEIQQLQKLLRTPRIQAPRAGRILRLRPPASDGVLRQAVAFAQIEDVAAKDYRVYAWVSDADTPAIAQGIPVRFLILGVANRQQFLRGVLGPRLAQTPQTRPGYIAVEIVPDETARAALRKMDRSLALSDHSMQAELVINVARRPMLTAMADAARRALLGFGFEV